MQILARNSIPLKIDHSYHHGTPTSKIARNLGSDSCLRNWMHQADADENDSGDRLASGEKKELAELRRRNRQLELENEILKRAAAYSARENVLLN